MNWSVGKIGTIYQEPAHAVGLSTPPIGCVLHLPGLPGGGSKIYDRSPYGNIGTITGAVWKRLSGGLWVLDFDGADDKVAIPDSPSLDIATQITLDFWLYYSGGEVGPRVCYKGDAYAIEILVSTAILTFVLGGVTSLAKAVALTTNTWTKITCTYDASYMRVFQDGTQTDISADQSGATINVNAEILYLGDIGNATRVLDGRIALFRIYNRALSALEIQNHFNREKHLFGVW